MTQAKPSNLANRSLLFFKIGRILFMPLAVSRIKEDMCVKCLVLCLAHSKMNTVNISLFFYMLLNGQAGSGSKIKV